MGIRRGGSQTHFRTIDKLKIGSLQQQQEQQTFKQTSAIYNNCEIAEKESMKFIASFEQQLHNIFVSNESVYVTQMNSFDNYRSRI
jgi:hypothetical protein